LRWKYTATFPDASRRHEALRLAGRAQAGRLAGLIGGNEKRRELEVEDLWPHKEWLVLKFLGVDSMTDAELLIGS
jgi:ribosomal 30S subunit maturation factor RimM